MNSRFLEKIIDRAEAQALCEEYRNHGMRVGFTSGSFDIIHLGHVDYLEKAKQKVDRLIVGVNSDSSVKSYKSPSRPIVTENARAQVIAALQSVDHVFIFAEKNNNQNITLLKPDVYLKAGDYTPASLSSKPLVESYGGSIEIIPFLKGFSSTSVIEKIELAAKSVEGQDVRYEKRPAIFVDRDGTIIEHVEYISEPEKVREIPGALAALKKLRDAGYRIVVVTNQPGIGLGYFSKEDLYAVNREMMKLATKVGLSIDRIYFCPHSKADGCRCRKPGTFLIERAVAELNIDLARSFMIGDMTSDVQLGENAGCGSVLVRTGRGGDDGICEAVADITSDSLSDAAARILEMGPVKVEVGAGARLHGTEEEIIQAIGRFGGDIGHDFNNIFGSSLACVDLIRQRIAGYEKDAEVEDILAILERAAQSGITLSNRIRGLARSGEIKKSAVSLLGCINSVVELLAQTKKNKCEFEVVCPEDITVEVADFTVIQTVLQLCENSLDAMRHLSERFILFGVDRVVITDDKNDLAIALGEYAVLSISDHGKGITAPRQGEVFNPFSSLKGRTVGKGLGLSMASAATVMKQHGGILALSSAPEIGTTLRLYFPLNMQK